MFGCRVNGKIKWVQQEKIKEKKITAMLHIFSMLSVIFKI